MEIIETEFKGLKVIEPSVFQDERGYFMESFNQKYLLDKVIQENESMSYKNVFRGMHYQLNPIAQAKLVRVIKGEVLDIVLDIRKGSPTFGKSFSIALSAANKKQFFIPEGFAHGFYVIEDCIMLYKCNNTYSKEYERGININSLNLNLKDAIIADKDKNHPLIENCETNFIY